MSGPQVDVAVIGVGTMGAQVLYHLARMGVRAVGFEQFAPGHDRSAAGGESKLFRTSYHEGSRYVPLLRKAREEWRRIESESGTPLLDLNGGLMIGQQDSAFLRRILDSAREHDIDHELLDGDALRRRFPQHAVDDGVAGVLDHESGFLRAEPAVAITAELAEARGAVVHRRCRVHTLRIHDDGIEVVSDAGTYVARRIVVSAGPWTSRLLPGQVPMTEVMRIAMTWFPLREAAPYRSGVFPSFVRSWTYQGAETLVCGWPSLDGSTLKVGLTGGWDRVSDPDALDRTVPDGLFDEIRAAVRELLPGVVPEVCRVGVYMDAYTADQDPFVGTLPADDRIVVLGGFSGHGFKMSPAVGLAAAELVVEGATGLPLDFLSPARFLPASTVADRARPATFRSDEPRSDEPQKGSSWKPSLQTS